MLPARRTLASGVATIVAPLLAVLIASPTTMATFPGEAGLLVFQQATEDGIQLFTMPASGGEPRQITHVKPDEAGGDGATQPDWSPDGTRIVFAYRGCQIGLIDADGANLTVLPVEAGTGTPGIDLCEADSSFTPDGQSVVFERYVATTGENSVWNMALDGTERTPVSVPGVVDPNVSPDGTRISFKGHDGGALVVAGLDGSDVVQVSPSQDVGYKSDWAPDGSALVFSDRSNAEGVAVNIATVAPDGTGMRYLTDYTEPGTFVAAGSYSPDGASIVYRVDQGDEHALFIMAADGSDVRQLTEFGAFHPSYLDWGSAQGD